MGIVDEVYDGESSSLVDEVYNESAPVKSSMWSKTKDYLKLKMDTIGKNLEAQNKAIASGNVPATMQAVLGFAPIGMATKAPGLLSKVLPEGREVSMYERAMKPSTTLSAPERLKRINTALEEKIPLTKKGVEKSKAIISDINDEIQNRIKQYGIQGRTADLENVVTSAEKMRQGRITGKLMTPEAGHEQVSNVIDEAMRNSPEKIPIRQAQTFKQNLNKELDDFYKAIATSPDKTTALSMKWTAKTKAALADGLRKEISNIFPEVTALNKREASLIQLNKSLDRAVNRISQHDILSLKGVVSAIKSPKWFMTNYILNNPTVQSSLAIAIRTARNKGLIANPPVKALTQATQKTAAIIAPDYKNNEPPYKGE